MFTIVKIKLIFNKIFKKFKINLYSNYYTFVGSKFVFVTINHAKIHRIVVIH